VLNYNKKVERDLSVSITTYSSSEVMGASQYITHFCAWKKEVKSEKNVIKMTA